MTQSQPSKPALKAGNTGQSSQFTQRCATILSALDDGKVIALLGPRRSGKQRHVQAARAVRDRWEWVEVPISAADAPQGGASLYGYLLLLFGDVYPEGPVDWHPDRQLDAMGRQLAGLTRTRAVHLTRAERAWEGEARGLLQRMVPRMVWNRPGWSSVRLLLSMELPTPWAQAFWAAVAPDCAIDLVELDPLSPAELDAFARSVRAHLSDRELETLGQEIAYNPLLANMLLDPLIDGRYTWSDVQKATLREQGPLRPFLLPLRSAIGRDPDLLPLLRSLHLPDEGPGIHIEAAPLGSERWQQLQFLFAHGLLRHTDGGFVGPCPLLQRWLQRFD